MSFFRREAETESPGAGDARVGARHHAANPGHQGGTHAGSARDRAVTRIAVGTRVTGEIGGSTELLVEGEVEGQVRVDGRVVVGAGGVVRGQITAHSVMVAGAVQGDVRGAERVEVGGSGRLEGDIAAPRVTIAEGAFFKGKVEMAGGEPGRRPARPERPPQGSGAGRPPGLFPEAEGEGSEAGKPPSGGEGR